MKSSAICIVSNLVLIDVCVSLSDLDLNVWFTWIFQMFIYELCVQKGTVKYNLFYIMQSQ